ncbi:MAG: AMP-binding protein [Clostridiales bacterium]|nr:AMP-binding protein [Clostridiales bacterium]
MKPFKFDPPPRIKDFRDMVLSSASKYGDKDLYVYKEDKQEVHFSYNRLKDETERFGTALNVLGIDDCRVAVIGPTSAKLTVTYLGTVNAGGVIVPLDREITHDQLPNFINRAECSAVVYAPDFNGVLTGMADKMPCVRYFIPMKGEDTVDDSLPSSPVVMPWEDVLALGKQAIDDNNNSYYLHTIDMEKMCAIIFTSGTTGTSKGVMLSQKNLVAAAWASCDVVPYDSHTRLLSVLPQHHTYEMTCSHLAVINLGASEYINDSLKYTMRNMQNYKPNALVLVPLFVETIYKKIWDEIRKKGLEKKVRMLMKVSDGLMKVGIDLRKKFFGQILSALGGEVQSMICGGAPISPSILKDFYSFGITIFEGYGITECAPLVACNPNGAARFGSVGTPVYEERVRIDKQQPSDEFGEIVVKGDNVMLGYYNDEEATYATFTHDTQNLENDGWFKTGDIGYIDKDNYIYITGRKKNVIILSNGKNVFPEELEEHLSHCDLIKESVIIGRKQDSGEVAITALIHPDYERLEGKSDEEIETAIKNAVNDINRALPSFKHMTEVEIKREEFEKTTSKKIKRYLYK